MRTIPLGRLSALGVTLVLGCGTGQQVAGFSADPSTAATDSSTGASSSGAATASDAGPVEQFTSADASPPGVTFDCKPGTYSGTFQTHVTSDGGGLLALYSLNVQGTLSIAIVGQVTQQAGELPQTSYSIAPGAKLTGVDQSFGGSYSADLVGQLDCATKTFSGTLNQGVYEFVLDAGSVALEGSMSGTYEVGDGGVPELSGTMTMTSPNIPTLGALGTWTATLQ